MKKYLCLLIALLIPLGTVNAAEVNEEMSLLYACPNTKLDRGRKYIGVNQESIKLAFSGVPDESIAESITFCDSNGNEPVGGIDKKINGNEITVSFGELKENTSYLLDIPEYGQYDYITMPKTMIDENFDSWNIGKAEVKKGYGSFEANSGLKYLNTDSSAEFEIKEENGDKYLSVKTNALKKNTMVGTELKQEAVDAKVVSFLTLRKTNENNILSAAELAGFRSWRFDGIGYFGQKYENLFTFDKNENGFYELMTVTDKHDTIPTGEKRTSNSFDTVIYDTIGGNSVKASSAMQNIVESNNKICTFNAVKTYHLKDSDINDSFDISHIKAGMYVIPKVLFEPEVKDNVISFYVNTDLINPNVRIYIPAEGQNAEIEDVKYENRKITVTLKEALGEKDYVIDFENSLSADGLTAESFRCDKGFMRTLAENEKLQFYVSPNGNDFNDGFAEERAVKSIDRVREIIDILKNNGRSADVTVNFDNGTYRFENKLELSDLGFALTFAGKENTVFTTAKQISESDFEELDKEAVSRLDSNVKNDVKALKLSKYLTAQYHNPTGTSNKIFSIYKGDREEKLSEYPDDGYHTVSADDFTKSSLPGGKYSYNVKLDRAKRWQKSSVFCEGLIEWAWKCEKLPNTLVNSADGTITFETSSVLKKEDRIRFLNIPEEITSKGEWAAEDGVLYYYSDSFDNMEISLSAIDLISLDNADGFAVNGITFKNISGSPITIRSSNGVNISGCKFLNIGKTVISNASNDDIHNLEIRNNYFENLSSAGINIYGGDIKNLTESNNLICNNVFNGIAVYTKTYTPAIKVNGVGNSVIGNTIRHSEHMCIGFSGSENKIMYNYITEACRSTGDCGAIYAGRNLTWVNNEIAYNYIENTLITNPEMLSEWRSSFQTGIYMDDRLGGSHIHHNYIKNAVRGIFIGTGSNNNIHDNVTENCVDSGISIGGTTEGGLPFEEDALTQDLIKFVNENPIYTEKYPWLSNMTDKETYTTYPHNNVVVNNTDIGSKKGFSPNRQEVNYTHENNVSGTDINSVLAEKGIDITSYNYSYEDNGVELVLPCDNELQTDIDSVYLVWRPVYGAKEYNVRVYDKNGYEYAVTTRNTHANTEKLEQGGEYFWQVKAETEHGEVTSPIYSFSCKMPFNAKRIIYRNENGIVSKISEAETMEIENLNLYEGECTVVIGIYEEDKLTKVTLFNKTDTIHLPEISDGEHISVMLIDGTGSMRPVSYKQKI